MAPISTLGDSTGHYRCNVVYPLLVFDFAQRNERRVVGMRSPEGAAPLSWRKICWEHRIWWRGNLHFRHSYANSGFSNFNVGFGPQASHEAEQRCDADHCAQKDQASLHGLSGMHATSLGQS
jgi:hypothetical protein